ncbi:MAG: hypothetical protein U1D30_07180 [Planctomycetota bacterium]
MKLYLQGFRNQGTYENVVNRILDDFVAACRPRRVTLVGNFTPRGGISTKVTVVHEQLCDSQRQRKSPVSPLHEMSPSIRVKRRRFPSIGLALSAC